MADTDNWLLWAAGRNPGDWETECGRDLSGSLVASPAGPQMRVGLDLPSASAAEAALSANTDLFGSMRISLGVTNASELRLSFPLPFHGVFIRRTADAGRPVLYIWRPWLGEAQGFRYIRPLSAASRNRASWRMGLPGGYYVQAPCEPLSEPRLPTVVPWLPNEDAYPEWVRIPWSRYRLSVQSAETGTLFWREIHETATKHLEEGAAADTDADDLNHRALMTFPVWLRFRLCDLLVRRLWALDKKFVMLKDQSARQEALARVWEKLRAEAPVLERRLVPVNSLVRSGRLHYCDPLNPADMASLLTQISRLAAPRGVLEMLPAEYRQNHPSFRGRICPVQTPESALVGLSLHLARGATVSSDGRIHPTAAEGDPSAELGYSANLIPFYQHNDCTRSMMGAKNLRQALAVAGRKPPVVTTGDEPAVISFVQPLIASRMCPSVTDDNGSMALGADVLVAYMPWMGLNFEDAIVVGDQLVQSGTFDVEVEQKIRKEFKPGWAPCGTLRHTLFKEEVDGLAPEGTTLRAGGLIASLRQEGDALGSPFEIRYLDHSPAQLRSIRFKRGAPWMGGVLEYVLVKHIPLRIGDKLMGRHGNKGVVGAIVPANEMPHLPDDPRLPDGMRGRPIDVILNPHGVISRMNIGQLLETHVGWLLHGGFTEKELLSDSAVALGQAFSRAVDHDKVNAFLENTGLTAEGKIHLDLSSGRRTCSPVAVGFQHIVRLKHIPELKAQARRGGMGARYSRRTGQAVHGRAMGGGQRLGEMEVWALAAHGLDHVLAESLGIRADSNLSRKWAQGNAATPNSTLPAGFAERFRDWLRALLIDLKTDGNHAVLSLLTSEAALKLIGPSREVRSPSGLKRLKSARFSCDRTREGFSCGFSVLEGEPIPVENGDSVGPDSTLRFGELLGYLRLTPDGPLQMSGEEYVLPLLDNHTGDSAGKIAFRIECKKDQVKAVGQLPDKGDRPKHWPRTLNEVFLYGRFSKAKGVNASADEVLAAFKEAGGQWQITDMRVTCPHHKTVPVRCHPPYADVYRGATGGLYDFGLFGHLQAAGHEDGAASWGYIRLPVEIEFPTEIFLGANWESILVDAGKSKADIPPISVLPVLPMRYRMPMLGLSAGIEREALGDTYREILSAAIRYRGAQGDKARRSAIQDLNSHVRNLFKFLIRGLSGKEGLVRHCGLGRRVDRSARLVITPNPDLEWDQAGVPTAVLLELCGDQINGWLQQKEKSQDLSDRVAASLSKLTSQELAEWRWMKSGKEPSLLQDAYLTLKRFYEEHPETVILLNRQPSLHRDNFQAFHPVPLPPSAGDVIQLCPLVCKGFGADFDGDEMVIHIPLSAEAQNEAERLLPSRNLLSVASGDVTANFDQDVVLGTYWATGDAGWHDGFNSLFQDECCRNLVANEPMRKAQTERLLRHVARVHPQQAPRIIHNWMRMAFDCCTQMGVSFGFYDLLDLSKKVDGAAAAMKLAFDEMDPAAVNQVVQQQVELVLGERLATKDLSAPGLHFATMAISGARGRDQSRQLIGARAFLSPGAIAFEAPPSRFLIDESLVQGMPAETAFFSAMNSRSSMCDKKLGTRQAGYLTRKLVTALWDYHVSVNDCGVEDVNRSVLKCAATHGCCSLCYGLLPDGSLAPVGFPVGLVAAQSIGERGTQLSMQSFHTGQKVFSIQRVLKILEGREDPILFDHIADAPGFVDQMRQFPAYRRLRDCHFQILWRVIHGSPNRSLRSAIESLGLFARISFERQARHLFLGALLRERDLTDRPPANVLFNRFGFAPQPEGGGEA